MKSECNLCKGERATTTMLVFNSNHTPIMHRFRYNQVLPLTGNDVMLFSLLGALQVVY